jgi:lysophospholipase L1-like esterase
MAFCFAALELFLWVAAKTATLETSTSPAPTVAGEAIDPVAGVPAELVAAAEARAHVLTMPEEWKRTPLEIPGAVTAFRWHGALHVRNFDRMRRLGPFPPKEDGVYRVMVVGDSLTYGVGIEESATFVEVLNRQMGGDFKIEFLNLGVEGDQSEDILKTVRKFVPTLKPNLVLYAICLNDFLPSGEGQYFFSYALPLPQGLKDFFVKHTRSAAYLSDLYDGALRRLHIRQNFFTDILNDFEGYQERFGQDVREMNAAALAAGLPPLVAMVVDQYPGDPNSKEITAIAEAKVLQAGATLISTANYRRNYSGKFLHVSRWEGHPNEVANFIWAQIIAASLRLRPDLQPFVRASKEAISGPRTEAAESTKPTATMESHRTSDAHVIHEE